MIYPVRIVKKFDHAFAIVVYSIQLKDNVAGFYNSEPQYAWREVNTYGDIDKAVDHAEKYKREGETKVVYGQEERESPTKILRDNI